MARGKKRNAQQQPKEEQNGDPESNQDRLLDPPAARIALHPTGAAVAVAVGPELRVYTASSGETKTLVSKADKKEAEHFVRAVAFDPSGRYLLSGGDDKTATLWDATTWQRLLEMRGPKKVTSVAFTRDGGNVLSGDKFGDVHVARVQPPAEAGAPPATPEPVLLLGHYCSILTSLAASKCGRLLATADRDKRARVSLLPEDPAKGDAPVQSICFGHTSFLTCCAFVQHGDKELLATGAGDGTVRIWDPKDGKLLSTLQVCPAGEGAAPAPEGAAEASTSAAAADPSSVLAVAPSSDGQWLAVIVEGRDEVGLVAMDWDASSLKECTWFALGDLYLPTDACFDASDRLWVVGGPPTDTSTTVSLGCAEVTADGRLAPVPDFLPAEARQALEAKDGSEGQAVAAAVQRRLVSSHLRKRVYTQGEGRATRFERAGK